MIRIALIDDHRMFRDGIKAVLQDEENMTVVAETGNAEALFELLAGEEVDLLITDITMPGMNGIEVTEKVKIDFPQVKVMILSMHTDIEFINKALQAGAKGYLPKDASMKELVEAINCIYRDEPYYHKGVVNVLLSSLTGKPRDTGGLQEAKLTPREMEIVELVVAGLANKEIADKLFISVRTVDTHKTNILQKLNLKSSIELVKYAIRNKLVDLDE